MGKRKSGTFRRGEDVRGFPEGTPFFAEGFQEGPVKLLRDLQDERLLVIGETLFASSHADYLERRYREKRHAITYDEGVRLATALTWLRRPYDRRPEQQRPEDGVPYLYDYELLAGQEFDLRLTAALVERSETEKLAWDALQQCIKWRRRNKEPVTGALLEWALDVAEGTRERPRRGRDQTTTVRNALIAETVKTLVACGMPKARNEESSTKKSAYDVVAEVFEMEYQAVVKAWNRAQHEDTASKGAD